MALHKTLTKQIAAMALNDEKSVGEIIGAFVQQYGGTFKENGAFADAQLGLQFMEEVEAIVNQVRSA